MITVEFTGGPRDGLELEFEDDDFPRGVLLAPVDQEGVPEGDLPAGTAVEVYQTPDGSEKAVDGRLRVSHVGWRLFDGTPVERVL